MAISEEAKAYFESGKVLLQRGESGLLLDEAIDKFRKALISAPNYPDLHFYLGIAYFRKGALNKAVEQFHQVIELRGDYQSTHLQYAHLQLGIIYIKQKSWEQARLSLEKVLEMNPSSAEAYFNLGEVYFKMSKQGLADLEQALKMYKKAVSLNPDYPEAHVGLGQVYREKKMFSEAGDEFRKADELEEYQRGIR